MAEFKGIDLALFTDPQLLELQKRVEVEIAMRRASSMRLASDRGQIVEDGSPRFRNPENPTKTWSGRGSQPEWVVHALASGYSLEDLLAHDDRPVQQPSPPGGDRSKRRVSRRRRRSR